MARGLPGRSAAFAGAGPSRQLPAVRRRLGRGAFPGSAGRPDPPTPGPRARTARATGSPGARAPATARRSSRCSCSVLAPTVSEAPLIAALLAALGFGLSLAAASVAFRVGFAFVPALGLARRRQYAGRLRRRRGEPADALLARLGQPVPQHAQRQD